MISPGAICMCPRASGAQLWVVVGRVDDGRWRLRGKRVDWRGRSDVTCRVAGAGEATLKALKEVERNWQRAMDKIAERASLTKTPYTRR